MPGRGNRAGSRAGSAIAAVAIGMALLAGAGSEARADSPADALDVVQIGNATTGGTSAATPVYILPVLGLGIGQGTTGTPIALPTSASGSNVPLTMSGSAGSEGALELSADGRYLTVAGYDATPGTAGVASSATIPRVLGRIDGTGGVDTSTVLKLGSFSGNNIRGAVSNDGNEFWATGAGGNPRGIVYAPLGNGAAATAVTSNNTNARVPVIGGGQLYLSTNNNAPPGLYKVGTGLPTGSPSATTVTQLVAATGSDPYGFVFTDANTLYVADLPGIKKYWFNGSTWVSEGSATAPAQLAGLTGKLEGGVVDLYATRLDGTALYAYTDTAASNAPVSSGSFTTLATPPGNALFKGVAFEPSGQVAPAPAPTIQLSDTALEGVIGDPSNPTLTATVHDDTVSSDQIQLTATSSNQAVAADGGITISGTGATRTISIQPAGTVGYATITLTATASGAPPTTQQFQYGASAPAPEATSHFLGGASDASTAIDVGGGYIVVGDDESNVLRLYDTAGSGGPIKTWDFTSQIGATSIDIEAAAQWGDTIYWIGSMSNSSTDASSKPARSAVFATQLSGSGASTDLTLVGTKYSGLRQDLINWDNGNGGTLGFAAGAQEGHFPKTIDGFNVEGLEFGSDGTAYLGFRAPLEPTGDRQQALVVPVPNFRSLVTGGGPAVFGTAMLWNLGGLSVRELRRNASGQYLVIAGSYAEGGDAYLYSWDGNPAHQPERVSDLLPAFLTDAWEGIPAAPNPLSAGASVQLLMDTGDWNYYDDNPPVEAKDLALGLRKSLIDTFTINPPSPPQITASATSNGSPYTGGTWTNHAVVVHFDCTDASGTGIASVPPDQTVSADGAGQSVTGTCTDNAGNSSQATFGNIQIDTTPPAITASATSNGSPYTSGTWTSHDVVVHFACTDGGSGVQSITGDQTVAAEGSGQSVGGSCTDVAGNSAAASFGSIQIDKTAPTVTYAPSGGTYAVTQAVVITCTPADALSGIASSTCANVNAPAWSFGPGSHTLSATATDRAGNTGSGSTTFAVTVSPTSLCTLTRQFVDSSSKYQSLKPIEQKAVDLLVTGACTIVTQVVPQVKPALKPGLIKAYQSAVEALVKPGWLTQAQADTLKSLAGAL